MMMQWSDTQLALHQRFHALGLEIAGMGPREHFDLSRWHCLREAGLWDVLGLREGCASSWWDFTAALEGLAQTVRCPALLLSAIAQAGYFCPTPENAKVPASI